MKAIDDRYKRAMIDEYEGHVRARRTELAEHVAETLLSQYGYDVNALADDEPSETTEAGPAPETTAVAPPPEAAVEPKPQAPTADTKPAAAKKTTAAPVKKTAAAPAKKAAAAAEKPQTEDK
ncbi:hypothetical protein [Streptomyces sp. NPDC001914]|uniref:hypothetical protein n=1 Tax=Streptomyces sp. NPDC001914 TaxID=3364623 RepID=UPI00367CF666